MRSRRRETAIFSISFLDCICCGFGGVLLLFVLTAGKQQDEREKRLAEVRVAIGRLEADVTQEQEKLQKLARRTREDAERRREIEERNTTDAQALTELERQLALLLLNQSTLEDEMRQLMEEKEAIPTVEEPPPLPIPNVERRQYLTGFKLEGRAFLILVRASGSMVAETVEEAINLQLEPEEVRRESPKWRRAVRAIEWLIASLPHESTFQVRLFAEETVPLFTGDFDRWIPRDDRRQVREVIAALNQVVPTGGANLERAFVTLRQMPVVPDSVLLITDGLPTLSDSHGSATVVSDIDRIRHFNAAARLAPRDIPINTLLFPLWGDPVAPFLFWQLSDYTKGALVCPAPSWPDT
jgi:hypothetical protein